LAVIFRTTIVTLVIVFVIKWHGKKGLGQLSTIELIIILGLGNAVSEPMLNLTGTSILHGYAVIIVAIAMFKMYNYLTTKYRRFSKMIVAKPILLLENGKILNKALLKARISREEFISYLRLGKFYQKRKRLKKSAAITTTIIGCCLFIIVVWIQF